MTYNFLNKKFKYTYKNACSWIIGINVFIFILLNTGNIQFKNVPLWGWISLYPPLIDICHWYWQFVTYMFVHQSFTHLFFNMYAILAFGSMLERCIGTREFLLYYLLTGTLGGVFCYLISEITGDINVATMGASGAVYALLFLTSVSFPTARVLLFFFIPLKMPVAVMVFIVLEVLSQVTGSAAGVAHLIHLSSMLVGWIYCLVRFRISPVKVWREALR